VFEKIALFKEPDRPASQAEVEDMKDTMVKWEEFKDRCIDKIMREMRMEKNKGKFKRETGEY